jgi:hypothetical protein
MDVKRARKLGAIFLAMIAFGCDRDDAIQSYNAPKDTHSASADVEPQMQPSSQPTEVTLEGMRMVVPAGWQPQPAQQMRIATFSAGKAEVVITKFGAEIAKQELLNINRWRGQVGLQPLPEGSDVAGEAIIVGAMKAQLFDFAGAEKRVRVAAVSAGDSVWYFKLQGASAEVARQQLNFDEFLRSIHPTATASENPLK